MTVDSEELAGPAVVARTSGERTGQLLALLRRLDTADFDAHDLGGNRRDR